VSRTFTEIAQSLVERIFSATTKITDLNPGSIIRTLIEGMSDIQEKFYAALKWSFDQSFILGATEENLDKKAAEWGLTRKQATKAVTVCVLEKASPVSIDTPINAGILVTTTPIGGSEPIYFVTTEATIIPVGSRYSNPVTAECTVAGLAGNVMVGEINLSASTGIDGVSNISHASGGTDAESDDDFRERVLELLRTPVRGGTKADYEYWALSVSGVTDAKCYPLNRGPGTVDVLINTTSGVPPESLLQAVAEYIETVRPIGADVDVVAPNPITVDVSVTLQAKPGYLVADLIEPVRDAIDSYISGVTIGDVVRLTGIGNAIIDVPGVLDYAIIAPGANVTLGNTDVAVPGTINVG